VVFFLRRTCSTVHLGGVVVSFTQNGFFGLARVSRLRCADVFVGEAWFGGGRAARSRLW